MQRLHDETDLIRSAQKGDLESFNQLVLKYQDRLYRQAYYMLGDAMGAEDAVQDALLSAYRALPGYRGGSFPGWLLRIVSNKCLDELRRRKGHPETSFYLTDWYGEEIESPCWSIDPGLTPEEHALNGEMGNLLLRSLEKLSPDHKTVLVLVDILGMGYGEAACTLGCPTGTIKSRLARARVQIRQHLVAEVDADQGLSKGVRLNVE